MSLTGLNVYISVTGFARSEGTVAGEVKKNSPVVQTPKPRVNLATLVESNHWDSRKNLINTSYTRQHFVRPCPSQDSSLAEDKQAIICFPYN